MESSLCEKPERHAPRRLSDHLGLEGLKQKVHSLVDKVYQEEGRQYATPRGTPQGGVISPLLSNILLTPFDKEMRRQGYRITA